MNFNVIKLNKEISELQSDNGKLIKQLADKETELAEAQKVIESLSEQNLKLEADAKSASANADKKIEVLKEEIKETDASAGKKAAQVLATLGVPEGTIKETKSEEVTDEQILAKFNAISGAAKSEFYQKHRVTILRASGLNK